jgi:hypothetical protein
MSHKLDTGYWILDTRNSKLGFSYPVSSIQYPVSIF